MRRHELTDEQFKKIENMLPGRERYVGVTAQDNRIFINGVLGIFKTGAPWQDLPERYGHWKNVHPTFSRCSKAGMFDKIFKDKPTPTELIETPALRNILKPIINSQE